MLIRAGILAACLFIASAQKEPRREVDLVTEPRPGQEFVHVHASSGPSKPNKHYIKGVQGDSNAGEVSWVAPVKTKLKSPSIVSPKKAQAASPVELSPIAPAKDSRLLRLTSYPASPQEAAPSLDEAHDFARHNITRGQLLHKPEDVSIEDEGMTGVIDESAVATPEERAILEQKQHRTSSYAVEEFPELELPANHKLSPSEEDTQQHHEDPADETRPGQKNSNIERERHLEKKVLNLETTKYEVIKFNEGETESKDGGLGKPSKKDEDEGQIDFVDSPLADKVLTPAGTSKASRTSIKKGPNGQDYEYEYVYYYYDEDEEDNNTRDKSPSPTPTPTTPVPTRRPPTSYTPAPEYQETPPRTRGKTTTTESTAIVYENSFRYSNTDSTIERGTLPVAEPAANEVLPPSGSRYTGRGRQLAATQAPATNIPVQEENLETNTRFPSRGRTTTIATEDTYIPIQTTLQQSAPAKETRGRNSGNVKRPSVELVDSSSFQHHSNGVSAPEQEYFSPQYPHSTDYASQPLPTAVGDDTLTTHSVSPQRGSRIRPSQNVEEEPTLGVQSVSIGSTQKQDLEEYVSTPSIDVDATRTRGFSSFRPPPPAPEGTVEIGTGTEAVSPSSLATTPAAGPNWRALNQSPNSVTGSMPDKAALDLWAYLQKTQNDESNNIIDDDRARSEDGSNEEVGPVVEISPSLSASTPYLTPSSTPSPSPTAAPTTTTTTEAPTSPSSTSTVAPTGRGRYRGSLTANRNRFKVSSTEQTPPTEENTTARRKFTPSHQRVPGQVSAYGRRGSKKTTSEDSNTSSTEASQSADEAESPKPFGSSTRGRYRGSGSRNSGISTTTTSAPVATETRSRPTFNADRYSRRKGASNLRATSTSAPSESESENKDESGKKDENESENASSTTAKPTIRGRINVERPSVRPLRPGPRISLGGRNRLPTVTKAPVAEEAETSPSPSSTASPVAEDAQPSNGETHDASSEAPVPSTTPDALTRLRNRPRLHVQTNKNTKPASPASASSRRQLVSGLLPKRRPNQPAAEEHSEVPASQPQEAPEEEAEKRPEADAVAANPAEPAEPAASSEQPSTTPETKLSSLIGRRRNLALTGRRPGTLRQTPEQ
nr:PREDICTED: flocculation protein FLO11-like [Bemisia tabaci]